MGAETRGVAVFDLDGTLTRRDTLAGFLFGYVARHPRRWPRVFWRVPLALAQYALQGRDRGLLKSRLLRAAMGGECRDAIARWAEFYVHSLRPRGKYRMAALRTVEQHKGAGDTLILMSASVDLYVPRIGAQLGFDSTICTEVRWAEDRLDGALLTANRRGEEKRRCLEALRLRYPGRPMTAYGNSASDIPHLRAADHAVLVNARPAARRQAHAAGIAIDDWH